MNNVGARIHWAQASREQGQGQQQRKLEWVVAGMLCLGLRHQSPTGLRAGAAQSSSCWCRATVCLRTRPTRCESLDPGLLEHQLYGVFVSSWHRRADKRGFEKNALVRNHLTAGTAIQVQVMMAG